MRKRLWYQDQELLRQERRERGVTQQQLADASGLTQSIVSEIENGERKFTVHYQRALWDGLILLSHEQNRGGLSCAAIKRIGRKADQMTKDYSENPVAHIMAEWVLRLLQKLSEKDAQIAQLEQRVKNFESFWQAGTEEALAHEKLEELREKNGLL